MARPFFKPVGDIASNHFLEQFELAREVQKNRTFGDAGARGHFFNAGGGIAFVDKKFESGLQYLARALVLAALATLWAARALEENG
jgi:hypothetical protein